MRLELYDLQEKKAYISDGKYSLPNLHFSLFSFPKTIHDTPPGTSPPFGGAWGGSLPSFLYSFLPPSKTATSSLFVIHFTEISPSTSEKHRFLQYSSPANHDSQPYSARHIPSFGGAWEGSLSLFLYSSPLPYKTATSSPFNCSSLRNKPFHT